MQRRLFIPLFCILAFNGPVMQAAILELAGVTVTPHVRAESMRYRADPGPDLSARVELFIRNTSPVPVSIPPDLELRFDGKTPSELLEQGQWAWHDTPDCWPDQPVKLQPDAITVWTFNGASNDWAPGTRHQLTIGEKEDPLLSTDFDLAPPQVWLSATSFTPDRGGKRSLVYHIANTSDREVQPQACMVYLSPSPNTPRSLTLKGIWPSDPRPGKIAAIPPNDRGWGKIPAEMLSANNAIEPSTHICLQFVLAPQGPQHGDNQPRSLWAGFRLRPENFDISGGWVADNLNGRQTLTMEPYLKTLKWLHLNTAHIAEVSGYTDSEDLYSKYPLKYFNKLQPFDRYDTPEILPRIHGVEFLGEPQYGGGRPVPPQEVFRELQPYKTTRLPTTVTHSEERIWRHYAGLSDFAHYDAYRVSAPAADSWRAYDRWGDKRIRWGAPLETIGDMTRSLREMYRPSSVAYWSQGAHEGWDSYGGRRRTSPTPDELRMQAYHALASRVTSLYWFNLSLKSLLKFPDLLAPIQQVNREIRLLETFYLQGDATSYQQTTNSQSPDWDLSVISAPEGSLLFALDLDYRPDPAEKVFQFNEPRPCQFDFPLPAYNRDYIDVFRVDGLGIYDVEHEATKAGVRIHDTRNLVGLYVATPDTKLRTLLQARLNQLIAEEQNIGFDPSANASDLSLLKSLLEP